MINGGWHEAMPGEPSGKREPSRPRPGVDSILCAKTTKRDWEA